MTAATAAGSMVVRSMGMATSVGLNAPSTCAAIRAGIRNMSETQFVVRSDTPLIAAQVPISGGWRGGKKLAKLLALSVRECLEQLPPQSQGALPLLVSVAEDGRPGRPPDIAQTILSDVEQEIGIPLSRELSCVFPLGRAGGLVALARARSLLTGSHVPRVLVAGVDSLLVGSSLAWLQDNDRLLSEENSNGFIPGEASSCVALDCQPVRRGGLMCTGLGLAREDVTIMSDEPFRADGLTSAVSRALSEAGIDISACALRLADLSGEHYYFREAALSLTRIQRQDGCYELWHPSECIGEVGAAIGPLLIGYAAVAARKGFLPGSHVLMHTSNDAGERAAACFRVADDPYVQ